MSKFFFHYNKPQSKLKGKPQVSIHFKGECRIVDTLVCNVPTYGKLNKKQPYFVMAGDARVVVVDGNNVAFIE